MVEQNDVDKSRAKRKVTPQAACLCSVAKKEEAENALTISFFMEFWHSIQSSSILYTCYNM